MLAPNETIAHPSRGLNMFFNCEVCFRFFGGREITFGKKRRKPPAFRKHQILRLVANPHCVSYVTCCWFTQRIHSQTSTFRAIPHQSSSISQNPRRPRWHGRPRGMPLTSFSSRSSQPFGRSRDAKHKKKLQPTPYSCILSTVNGFRGPLRPLSTTAILISFVAEGSFSTEQRSLKSRELLYPSIGHSRRHCSTTGIGWRTMVEANNIFFITRVNMNGKTPGAAGLSMKCPTTKDHILPC